MIPRLLDDFAADPIAALVSLATLCVSLALCVTVHEFSHAYAATRLGDDTALRLGRVSLNPIRHLDPLGSAMLLLAGFGWGKPVPVEPRYLRIGERAGMAAVALAGPLSNIIAAVAVGVPLRFGLTQPSGIALEILLTLLHWNLILAVFNLLPVAPLDGFKVALGVLPPRAAAQFAKLEPYGPLLLLGVVGADFILRIGILSAIVSPPLDALRWVILGV